MQFFKTLMLAYNNLSCTINIDNSLLLPEGAICKDNLIQ